MSQFGTTLADAAKAYKDACEERDLIERRYREISEQKEALLLEQEAAQSRASKAAKFLRLVAQHGPVEDWGRDYMAEEAVAPQSGQFVNVPSLNLERIRQAP